MDGTGLKSSHADPDVWLRPAVKPDGEKYYEYILVYVDDILTMSCDPKGPMEEIQRGFKFKNDEIKEPSIYLGAKLERKSLNGKKTWTMSSLDHVKFSVENVEKQLKRKI